MRVKGIACTRTASGATITCTVIDHIPCSRCDSARFDGILGNEQRRAGPTVMSSDLPLGTHDGVLDGVVDEVQRLLVADQVPQPVAGQQQAVVLGI